MPISDKPLDPNFFENIAAAGTGTAVEHQALYLQERSALSAVTSGNSTDSVSIVLVQVQRRFHDQAYDYLKGVKPINASLMQASGNLGIDFVICGLLPPNWAAINLGPHNMFLDYIRFEATRHYRYKGRNLDEIRGGTGEAIV